MKTFCTVNATLFYPIGSVCTIVALVTAPNDVGDTVSLTIFFNAGIISLALGSIFVYLASTKPQK